MRGAPQRGGRRFRACQLVVDTQTRGVCAAASNQRVGRIGCRALPACVFRSHWSDGLRRGRRMLL